MMVHLRFRGIAAVSIDTAEEIAMDVGCLECLIHLQKMRKSLITRRPGNSAIQERGVGVAGDKIVVGNGINLTLNGYGGERDGARANYIGRKQGSTFSP